MDLRNFGYCIRGKWKHAPRPQPDNSFSQGSVRSFGNPLAVVLDTDDLGGECMARDGAEC
jgi:hypothetical protein